MLRFIFCSAVLLLMGVCLPAAATDQPAPLFSDALLTQAVAEKAPRWKGTPGQRYREMKEVFALHLTALAAHRAPQRTIAGTTLADNVAQKILSFLRSGGPDADGFSREPEAYGGLGGWTHSAAAHTLLLAKRTPEIWRHFSADDRHRADLVMHALAVAAHFTLEDGNDYPVAMDGVSIIYKSWNPNITEGYADVIIAASLYFGADELDAFFTAFDFDAFVTELRAAQFHNILRGWTHTPAIRDLVMRGGQFTGPGGPPPKTGGTTGRGHGVRHPFHYRGWSLSQPWEIYRLQANLMFSRNVRTQVTVLGDNRTHLMQRATQAEFSPWEGQMGMLLEFETTDWNGVRSSLGYAYEGAMIHLGTAATLRVLGEWRDDPAGRDIERRMSVGIADLMFKAKEGYRGWSLGLERLNWLEQDLQPMGSDYIFPLWTELFAPAPEPSWK